MKKIDKEITDEYLDFNITENKEKSYFRNKINFYVRTDPLNWVVKRSVNDFMLLGKNLNE